MGKVLGGRYRVISHLGEGGMGSVYLCEHAVLRRRLAVKVLRPDLVSDPELVDRFRNEAIAASRIGQENVVDVLDFGTAEDGALYYVMEALDGRSLGAAIREDGPLEVGRALGVLEQICRALAAAHARGVVHRDVKPDNVFLARREDGSEIAKVIDFGISHVPPTSGGAPITRTGAIIGTPEYMAPEQAAGAPVDLRSDVYAVGVLAYEMLTGELPIAAATPIATLVAHQTRTPDPPSRRRGTIPLEVDALVLRALAKRPEERFASMDAFAAEVGRVRAAFLRSALRAQRPSSPRGHTIALPESREELARTLRVRRVARVALLLVLFAALCGAAWLSVARTRERVATSAGAAAVPTATPTSTPTTTPTTTATATATRTATSTPTALSVPAAVRADEPSGAAPRSPERLPEAARPKPTRRARPAEVRQEDDGLKDPYSTGGELKDPFQ
ncbi:MAG TPA: serine/threonine-protein kinase [Anaeromyxobacter sp.]|nr:serine/threonine-protein kinase [Anaeromyxobacter sp.]